MIRVNAVDVALNAFADQMHRQTPLEYTIQAGDPQFRPDAETRQRVGKRVYVPGDFETSATMDAISRPFHEHEQTRALSRRGPSQAECLALDVERVIKAQERPLLVMSMALWLYPVLGLHDDGGHKDVGQFVFSRSYDPRFDEYLYTRTMSPKRRPETLCRGARMVWGWFRQDLWTVVGKVSPGK